VDEEIPASKKAIRAISKRALLDTRKEYSSRIEVTGP